MNNKRLHVILVIILMSQLATAWQTAIASGQAPSPTREVPITVKVVLVGFEEEWVDKEYFVWDYQTPSRRSSVIWNWSNWQQTGVTYNITYDLTFADWDFKEGLVKFLRSIGEKRSGENRWFYNWEYSDADKMFVKKFHETEYVVYDATEVEEWLYDHSGDYGGLPENGWTFIVTFLPELPSFYAEQYRSYWDSVYQGQPEVPSGLLPHYYAIEAVDADLGYSLRYRDFMTGYGGRHRLWFTDLTAGPTWWSQYEDLPLNTVIQDQDIRLSTSFGKQWLTQLLADYTSETVYNVVLPEFVYDPIYASKYKLVVKVLDNRTDNEKEALPIQRTINQKAMEDAFKGLIPYADVQVDLQFEDAANYPALRELTQMSPKANVALLACPEEEIGGELGLGYVVNHVKLRGDAAIVLDASPSVVSIGASGVLWGKVVVRGKQGHAGYPHTAKNAIDEAIPFLERLCKYSKIRERIKSKIPAPPDSPHKSIWGRFSVTMLNAGQKENIIPGECEARFDLRVCPDENYESAKKAFTRYFEKLRASQKVEATLEYTLQNPSNYFTDPKHPLVRKFAWAANEAFGQKIPIAGELGGNDGHYFAKVGIPVISFGPIRDDCRFHGVDEFVCPKDIELVKKTIVKLVSNWNAEMK